MVIKPKVALPTFISRELERLVSNGLRDLLETKHLYQCISLSTLSIIEDAKREYSVEKPTENLNLHYILGIINRRWALGSVIADYFTVKLPTIKVYCDTCARVEAFNPSPNPYSKEHVILAYPDEATEGVKHQLFVIEYECQSCKGLPVVFMIRRKNLKIYLVGRYPIETAIVPDVIPKEQRKYYSGAIIAHHCGQTLAGLFLLRVLIEQYTKKEASGKELKADKLIEKYMKGLPEDFKKRFPSLNNIYSNLSDAIHLADASAKLFDNSRKEIVTHFDARRLFDLKNK